MSQNITVRSKEELKRAKEAGFNEIIILGDLAKSVYAARKIKNMSKSSILALSGLTGLGAITSPFSGGLSLGLSSAMSAPLAGLSMETISLIILFGSAIFSIINDYDFEYDPGNTGNPRLVLKKRE